MCDYRFLALADPVGGSEAFAEVRCKGWRVSRALQAAGRSASLGNQEPGDCALPRDPDLARMGRKSMTQTSCSSAGVPKQFWNTHTADFLWSFALNIKQNTLRMLSGMTAKFI